MARVRTIISTILAGGAMLGACTTGATPSLSFDPETPVFSNATDITNTYLPWSDGGRWIYEGRSGDTTSLVEAAVTPLARTIAWSGGSTETVVIRRRTWVDGVLTREAREHFAQDDGGGVWSFGVDVDRFRKGDLADHEGSWLAGVDGGQPALVMPADPAVGQGVAGPEGGRAEIVSLTEPVRALDGSVNAGLVVEANDSDARVVYAQDIGEVLRRSSEGSGEVRLIERLADNAESAAVATFSSPTTVDNPFFGVTGVDYRLYTGRDEGEPLRIEVAPTGETKPIEWTGGTTEAVVSQFIAMSDRTLLEIAVDWFAQDDAGNVWYFGEDVWNYEDGRVANMDGTWIAGADGPPGMIMPGSPTLGQRFNPENIPGNVFETVDVQKLGETYALPGGGRLNDVLVLHETLDDGTEETKGYAPGYGNVSVSIPGVETVDIIYALPNDAIDARIPGELRSILGDLSAMSIRGRGTAEPIRSTFGRFLARGDAVSPILIALSRRQLGALEDALGNADRAGVRATALDLEQTVLDIARLYRAERPFDMDVLDLLARRMLAAADARDEVAAATAAALSRGVADRNVVTFSGTIADATAAADTAAETGDLSGVARAAKALRAALV